MIQLELFIIIIAKNNKENEGKKHTRKKISCKFWKPENFEIYGTK